MRIRPLASAVAAAGVLALTTAAPAHAQATVDVSIKSFQYQPPTIDIAAGDTVRWTNGDFVEHTATLLFQPTSFFNTGTLGNGQSGSVTFPTPGAYTYYCMFHTDMRGLVNVTAAPDPVVPEAPIPALLVAGGLATLTLFASARARRPHAA